MKERIVKLTSTNAKKIHVLMAQLALTWKMLLSVNVYQVLQHYFIKLLFFTDFYIFIGFTGLLCNEQIDECALNPCVNGTCHDKVNGFECECLPGFTGVKCEININECESNPCQNEATCYDFDNRYECKCVAGYEGKIRIFIK